MDLVTLARRSWMAGVTSPSKELVLDKRPSCSLVLDRLRAPPLSRIADASRPSLRDRFLLPFFFVFSLSNCLSIIRQNCFSVRPSSYFLSPAAARLLPRNSPPISST